jgi:hypothetical protein
LTALDESFAELCRSITASPTPANIADLRRAIEADSPTDDRIRLIRPAIASIVRSAPTRHEIVKVTLSVGRVHGFSNGGRQSRRELFRESQRSRLYARFIPRRAGGRSAATERSTKPTMGTTRLFWCKLEHLPSTAIRGGPLMVTPLVRTSRTAALAGCCCSELMMSLASRMRCRILSRALHWG